LNEAKLFAHAVLAKWSLGRCKEDVVVLYSLHDGVVSGAHCSCILFWGLIFKNLMTNLGKILRSFANRAPGSSW